MFSCYIVRKLYESKCIKKSIYNSQVEVSEYKSLGKKATSNQSRKLHELYELNAPSIELRPFSFVINQLIHSFSFVLVFREKNHIEGFAFNSDKTKNGAVYLITLSEFLSVLSPIAGYNKITTTLIQNKDDSWQVLKE